MLRYDGGMQAECVLDSGSAPEALPGTEAVPQEFLTPQGEDLRALPLTAVATRIETLRGYQQDLARDRAFYESEIVRRAVAAKKARKIPDDEFEIEITYAMEYSLDPESCAMFRDTAVAIGVPKDQIDMAVSPPRTVYSTKYKSAMKLATDYGGELVDIVRLFDVEEKAPKLTTCKRRQK